MAATYSKPTKINEWADTGVIVEPSEAKKDTGWVGTELPPASMFNWWQNISGQWTKWFDERLADGVDENEFVINNPDSGGEVIRFKTTSTFDGFRLFADSNVEWYKNGSSTLIFGCDFQDWFQYSQSLNRFGWAAGNSIIGELSANGLYTTGGLVVGTSSILPSPGGGSTQKLLQFGNKQTPVQDGDFWMGWQDGYARIKFSDPESVVIDSFNDNLRFFHGSGASIQGLAGTNDVEFLGDVSVDGGVYLLAPFGGVPAADYIKIATDEFRLSSGAGTGDVDVHWNFTNDDRLAWNNTFGQVRMYFGGVHTLTFADSVIADNTNDIDIGAVTGIATGSFFESMAAREFVPADANSVTGATPGLPPNRINARTTPFLICHVESNGLSFGISHNVASVTKTATGTYALVPHVATGSGDFNAFATVNSGGFASAQKSGGDLQVKTYNTSGTLTDLEFSVIAYDLGWIA